MERQSPPVPKRINQKTVFEICASYDSYSCIASIMLQCIITLSCHVFSCLNTFIDMFNYCDRCTKWKKYFFIVIHLLESIFGKNTHIIAYRHIHYTPHWPSLICLKWIIWQFISLCHNLTSPAFLVLLFAPLRYFSFLTFKIFIISYKVFHL